jgi:uncharacterized YigZ family protein
MFDVSQIEQQIQQTIAHWSTTHNSKLIIQKQTMSYLIPSRTVRVEQEIKRSRFIATMGRAEDKAQALAFIERVRSEFPDASHHCWAYVAGPPDNTLDIGLSDDGEPRGTAGRPMLNVLQFKDIGESVVVVTRYFGGTKLGAGGLVRAYSGSVQQGVDALSLIERIDYFTGRVIMSYAMENTIRHLLETLDLAVNEVTYDQDVALYIKAPASLKPPLEQAVQDQTMGAGRVLWDNDT